MCSDVVKVRLLVSIPDSYGNEDLLDALEVDHHTRIDMMAHSYTVMLRDLSTVCEPELDVDMIPGGADHFEGTPLSDVVITTVADFPSVVTAVTAKDAHSVFFRIPALFAEPFVKFVGKNEAIRKSCAVMFMSNTPLKKLTVRSAGMLGHAWRANWALDASTLCEIAQKHFASLLPKPTRVLVITGAMELKKQSRICAAFCFKKQSISWVLVE